MQEKLVVIVSSTARDLPDYRAKVMDACLRAGMFPKMMEHLPALDADAIRASIDLVNEADVYVGIFAHRYGYVPAGHDISVTQMEFERAVERGIPTLIFLMDDEVPVLPRDYDKGDAAEKLEKLKARLLKDRVVAFFKSPEDLRGLVVHSLDEIRKKLDAARAERDGEPADAAAAVSLHYVSEIPRPPEAYVAHPYTLLQVRGLVGRKKEMELLTDWVTGKRGLQDVRVFNVVAIGGMGKSALTWTWFNDVAPQEMKPLAGRMWWSFYESDATFENFVTRALAYVSHWPLDEVKDLPFAEQEDQLRDILDREPFLLVLDGLERILTAYARLDAPYLRDENALDDETANRVAGAYGLPKSAGQSFVGKHKLRMTADPRAGRFLRELTRVRASRILVSTRLYPADLQAPGGAPSPGCFALFLPGLSDQDALELWRAYGARGSREVMLPVFRTFDKHPLLLQLLAYEVADFREAPGDFDAWRAGNPDFDPFGMELANVQSHVLDHALRGLSAAELRTLHVIAGFRMPASMDTLKALLIRAGEDDDQKPFTTLRDMDGALTTLEDRGLLGWDRRSNRYDLHPIVRGVVWSGLDDHTRAGLYGTLRTHFEAIEEIPRIESIDDLRPAIELYNTLVGLKVYDQAFRVFNDRISEATLHRLSASSLRVELLEALFEELESATPRIRHPWGQTFVLAALAQGYQFSGRPGDAIRLYERVTELAALEADRRNLGIALYNQALALRVGGSLRATEASSLAALRIAREQSVQDLEMAGLYALGLALGTRGEWDGGTRALVRALRIARAVEHRQGESLFNGCLAALAIWEGNPIEAKARADLAWDDAADRGYEADYIRAARLQGTAAVIQGDHGTASERLHHALVRARAVSQVEEELPTLVALADLHARQGEPSQARATLDDVWDAAERGPYPLFHADALNVLAQIERDEGNRDAAVEAATKAYQLAWCDGPPYAYHSGLEKARAHLRELGAPEPEMPPFDESQYEPIPAVEINPPDEFSQDREDDEDE